MKAAQDVKRQMIERAATLWEISKDDIAFDDGTFRSKSDASKSITFKELAARVNGGGAVRS